MINGQYSMIYLNDPLIIAIHDDISLTQFVIPGLTRNPVFSWISAFAGMTPFDIIDVVAYK